MVNEVEYDAKNSKVCHKCKKDIRNIETVDFDIWWHDTPSNEGKILKIERRNYCKSCGQEIFNVIFKKVDISGNK